MPDNSTTRDSDLTPISPQEPVLSSFRLSATGLQPIGTPTIEDWQKVGEFINRSERSVHFWIGDWLNYGETTWGDRYREAEKATRYDNQTLRNDKWVASRIPPERRFPEISFSHHKEVAELPPEEQDELLTIARDNKLSYEKFRKVVKEHGKPLAEQASPRGDKPNEAQKLIDDMLVLTRRCNDAKVDQFSPEESFALITHAKDLRLSLETFIALYEQPDNSST